MSRVYFLLSPLLLGVFQTVCLANEPRYLSAVELTVQEPDPELIQRGQRLVLEQFSKAFGLSSSLKTTGYEARTRGNEVVFFISSGQDVRLPVQAVLAEMIDGINGRVLARGRSSFYKAALSQPVGGYLQVEVDDSHKKVLAIAAQSVPLRDLLKEIRNQSEAFSYLMPGDCADRLVDWSFGVGDGPTATPKEIDQVMNELATLFGLKCEKKNGTFIFSGYCPEQQVRHSRPSQELLTNNLFNNQRQPLPRVFFPVSAE